MPDGEHIQLLEKLAEIKQDSIKQFGELTGKMDVNTVKTTSIELTVSDIKSELKDIRLGTITHSEFEARFKIVDDHELRLRSLESKVWKAIGALTVVQLVILPVILYLFLNK